MFPTNADLHFWESRHRPRWAGKLKKSIATPIAIDYVIEAHAGVRHTSGEIAASNLLAIVKAWRRHGFDLARELETLAVHPQCAIHPEKRAAFARKWSRRMTSEKR